MAILSGGGTGTAVTLGRSSLIYRYTVTGSDKAGIDTGVDTAQAGSNDWTGGDLLEVYFYARTDEATVTSNTLVTLNNDTGNVYDFQNLSANNVTPAAAPSVSAAGWSLVGTGASKVAGACSVLALTIPNYSGAVLAKAGSALANAPDSTAANQFVLNYALLYRPASPAAVTRLKVIPLTALKKYVVGSQLLIYKRLSA